MVAAIAFGCGCGDDDDDDDDAVDAGDAGDASRVPDARTDADARPRDARVEAGPADPCIPPADLNLGDPGMADEIEAFVTCNGPPPGAGERGELNGPCTLVDMDPVSGCEETREGAGLCLSTRVGDDGYCTEQCTPVADVYSTNGCPSGSICYQYEIVGDECSGNGDCQTGEQCLMLTDGGRRCIAQIGLCLTRCAEPTAGEQADDCSPGFQCDTDYTCWFQPAEPMDGGVDDGGDAGDASTDDADAGTEDADAETPDGDAEIPVEPIVLYGLASIADGDIGSRADADTLCMTNLPEGVTGTNVHAFLSFSAEDEIADFPTLYSVPTDRVVETANGTQIGDDWADLLDGSIDATLLSGGVAFEFWSGSNNDGTVADATCSGWTSAAIDTNGAVGDNTSTTDWLLRSGDLVGGSTRLCTQLEAVLCLAY